MKLSTSINIAFLSFLARATSTYAGTVMTGGFATFFSQGGVAGACGTVHQDSDLIGAIDVARYGNPGTQSSLCFHQARITNVNNGKSVTITITDVCVSCQNNNSFDLSTGAFSAIASLSDGIIPITWEFL
ncbi:hypothetical protein GALMADRAFT_215445 [Galerina marginata CBS 339.88]|uniref:Expansin-like EG45 domain-containing protein n=1 Tax=Galerina marginata (strain CBS 339.88) TaxID=685588 RepID=A0A067SPX8_GALM3|nr:hypothetical protein GALMADRAFT_215445 [Galerina marginata CBS 339.88]